MTCYTDCKDDYVCTCSVSADFVSVFNGKQIEVTVTCSDTNLSKSLEEIPFDVEGYVVNGGMGCNPMTNAPISVYIQPSVISWGKFTGRSAATFNSSCNDFRWYNKYIKIWQDNFAAQTKDGRLVRCIFR